MSEVQPVPRTHRITVTVSEDRTVHVTPAWKRAVRCGDSIVWSFRGRIDPEEVPVVALEPSPSVPGTPEEAFDEITVSAHRVQGRNVRGGTYECRYGFRTESGAVEILKCVSVSPLGKPGVKVLPPPPDGN